MMAHWKCLRLWVLASVLLSVGCDRLQDQPTPAIQPPPHLSDTTLLLDVNGVARLPLPNVVDLISGTLGINYTVPAHGTLDFSQGAQGIVTYKAGPTFTTEDTASFILTRTNYPPTHTKLTFKKGALCIPIASGKTYRITSRPKIDLLNAFSILVLNSDSVCPNSQLSFVSTSSVNPRFSISGNSILYQPDTSLSHQFVRDSVNYKVCSGSYCGYATVRVEVEPALAPPCNLPFRAYSDTIDVIFPGPPGYRDTVSILRILGKTLRQNCPNTINISTFRFDNANPQYPLRSQGPGRNYTVENNFLGANPNFAYISRGDSGTIHIPVYFSVRKRNSLDVSNAVVMFRYRP